jgi:hypothetical protein
MRRFRHNGRNLPWFRTEEETLQKIDEYYKEHPDAQPCKAVTAHTYNTLSRIANRKESDQFEASNQEISELSGLSRDSVLKATSLLAQIADINKSQSPGRSANSYELFDTTNRLPERRLNRLPERRLNRLPERRLPENKSETLLDVVSAQKVYNRLPERRLGGSHHYIEEPSINRRKNIKNGKCHRFSEFWEPYPRQEARARAEKEWAQLDAKTQDQIIKILPVYKFPENPEYIPLPANWLRDRRWEDKQITRSNTRRSDEDSEEWRKEPGAAERLEKAREKEIARRKEQAEKERRGK